MILEGEFGLDGPQALVWDLLQDPEVLVKALPGAKTLFRTAEDCYEGVMEVGIGPVTAARFTVKVNVKDKLPHRRMVMEVDSQGEAGFGWGTAQLELAERSGGGTLLSYRADLKLGGKIASLGQRLLESVAKTMTRQGLAALNRELKARLAAGSDGAQERAP